LIVVDTSVWIDVFRDNESAAADLCLDMIERGDAVGITEVIFTEVLQGIADEAEALHVEGHFRGLPMLRLETVDTWSLAAKLYRDARRNGNTIRNTADCLIAAPCIRAGATLLHQDADFDRLASCSELKVLRVD
jgi:predicted nucleic acid-binding protein